MRLERLANALGGTLHGQDADVRNVTRDSRRVSEGDLFAALPGERRNGADYAEVARAAGAAGILTEAVLDIELPQIVVKDARRAMAHAAHAVHGDPTASLEVVGITGTNGKTTVAYLVDAIVGDKPTALMGTIARRAGGKTTKTHFTTPESDDVAAFMRLAVDSGDERVVMEVSSHGLAMDRVLGVRFAVAAFTNLSQDHLDYHGSMVEYAAAKERLFFEHDPRISVVNVDDAHGATLAARLSGSGAQVLRTSAKDAAAEVVAYDAKFLPHGLEARVQTPAGSALLTSPLVGEHNLENLLTTLGIGTALGRPLQQMLDALSTSGGAPGRLERIEGLEGVAVLVDYAHTPDALARAIAAVRPVTTGRLIVVFGCGGDRDREKRPQMGQAAAEGADLVVITSDNPRTEEPDAIVDEIEPAVRARKPLNQHLVGDEGYARIVDRALAIESALKAAQPGDSVLIAGKGHEDYQIIGTERRDFDDREVARDVIARRVESV